MPMRPPNPPFAHQGAALIEFVLLLGLLFLLVVGVVDLAVLMRVSYNVSEASRHGARSAAALWTALPGCPVKAAATARCDNTSVLGDIDVQRVADAACTYIELAGLARSEWNFSFETLDRPWTGQNNTAGSPLRIGHVRLDQSGGQQCVFCWNALFQAVALTAQSSFYLQGSGCLLVTP